MTTTNNNNNNHPYNDALRLDLSVLEALLKRNQCAHSKAKYYQRASMAIRAIHKSRLLELYEACARLVASLRARKQQQQTSKRKRDDDNEWDLSSLGTSNKTTLLWDTKSIQSLHTLQNTLQQDLPQILSRLEYAAQAFFGELQRGFFLPFCTVAVGALGRIRVLTMKIGHAVLDQLQQIQQEFHSTHQKKTDDWFLTKQELSQLRQQFTEPPPQRQPPLSQQEKRFQQIRQRLGFTAGSSSKQPQAEGGEGNGGIMEEDPPSKGGGDKKAAIHMAPLEDDDLGQPVLLSGTDEASTSVGSSLPSSLPSSRSVSPAPPYSASTMKSAVVQSASDNKKKDKKDKKKKDKKRKSKEETSGGGESKKKRRKNFFDDLFG